MSKYELRKQALETVKKIDKNREKYYVIHYTCDDFKKSDTVTSIVISHFSDGETTSFSLDQTAKILDIQNTDLKTPETLNKVEKKMLESFSDFVKNHDNNNWVHWNMNSDSYGFKALELRAKVLKIQNFSVVNDDRKLNLSKLFAELYDRGFAKNPQMENLMKLNKISDPGDYYPGYSNQDDKMTEPKLFEQGKYKTIRLSCLRKVKILCHFLNLEIDKKLITLTPKRKLYGLSIKGLYALLLEQWWSGLLIFFLGYLATKLI
ncbi:hypothetical protein, partial [Liquorilactobacillus hordei]|uniref:hypothetical protein n=1 Tax=Liquorilactobacillus hordei TaxID=468911 RepID=UPI0039ECB3BD